jgi:predicted CoA-binding protein
VTPKEKEVLGHTAVKEIKDLVNERIDTVTVYVNPAISSKYTQDLIALKPKRVIFNPGAENPQLAKDLKASGIGVEDACTLVLLRTNQY